MDKKIPWEYTFFIDNNNYSINYSKMGSELYSFDTIVIRITNIGSDPTARFVINLDGVDIVDFDEEIIDTYEKQ